METDPPLCDSQITMKGVVSSRLCFHTDLYSAENHNDAVSTRAVCLYQPCQFREGKDDKLMFDNPEWLQWLLSLIRWSGIGVGILVLYKII